MVGFQRGRRHRRGERVLGIPAIPTTRSGFNRPAISEDCVQSFQGESSTLGDRPTRMVLFYWTGHFPH